MPDAPVAAGDVDLLLPDTGSWRVRLPIDNDQGQAVEAAMRGVVAAAGGDADADAWRTRAAYHGFIDFNHIDRPRVLGVGTFHEGKAAVARTTLVAPSATRATLRFAY